MESRVEKQMKSRWNEAKSEERRCNSAKVRTKTFHRREMLEKSRKCYVFSMIRVSGESKSRLVKAAGAESCGRRKNEKFCAAVARSAFWSENVQNTSGSDHFFKLRCWKIERCCGEKHICKWKCTKHVSAGPLFEVRMSKKCTPLWREAHFQVKMFEQLTASEHFLKFRCQKISHCCDEKPMRKSKCTNYLCFGALFEVQMLKNQSVSKFVSQSISQVVIWSLSQLVTYGSSIKELH